jgi:hypothetical protein
MKCILLFLGFTFICSLCYSQTQCIANFGLTSPQDSSTLPRSSVAIEKPVRKPKVKAVTILKKVHDNNYILTGGWELAEASKVIAANQPIFSTLLNTNDWYNTTVPGTVLRTPK